MLAAMSHLPEPDALHEEIVRICESAGHGGVPMGQVVDRLVAEGFAEEEIEQRIWTMIAQRHLTPNGFVRRRLRIADRARGRYERRCYEFTLIAWSEALDHLDQEAPPTR